MTGTETLERPETEAQTGHRSPAHIIRKAGGDGGAAVTESLVKGTPLEALCGHVFVPSRDTKGRPVCDACKSERERLQGGRDA